MTLFTDKGIVRALKKLAAAVFWIAVWYLAAVKVGQELILPSPLSAAKTLISLAGEKSFWISSFSSLGRILSGFVCGTVLGTALAALTAGVSAADVILSPALRIMRATPVASFIILALLWIGKAKVPGFISALMVIPVVWASAETAIKQTDGELLEMARVYRLGAFKTLKHIYIPSVMPAWNSACVTAMGLAWKSGIAAEVLCLPKNAMGSELYYSKIYLETPSLFAWTAVVVTMSMLLESAFVRIMRRKRK